MSRLFLFFVFVFVFVTSSVAQDIYTCGDINGQFHAQDRPCDGMTPLKVYKKGYVDQQKQYVGEVIILFYETIEFKSFAKIIEDFSGYKIIVSEDINGNIALSFKNTPWDEVLDMVLSKYGLTGKVSGETIYIARQ